MDFSFAEFAIIGVVALLVIGPDKLPGLARTAGLWVGKVRGFINSVKTEIDAELKMDEIKNAVKGGNNSLHEISEIIRDTRSQFQNSINPNASIKDAINTDAPADSDKKQEYLVKAIPDDFDEEGDSAHHDVEDDFVDDYASDYEIEEIEVAPKEKPKPVKKAKAKTKAKKKAVSKKAATPAKKKAKKKAKTTTKKTES